MLSFCLCRGHWWAITIKKVKLEVHFDLVSVKYALSSGFLIVTVAGSIIYIF